MTRAGTRADEGAEGRAGSLSERAYARLRGEIITCALRPGADLSEGELAARLRMSKTPVRDALGRLVQEGLVEAFPRRGYRVTPVSVKDVSDLFVLRSALEGTAAELAATRMTAAELDALEAVGGARYARDAGASVAGFVEANNAFHTAIARGAGVPRLHALIVACLEESTRLFHMGAAFRDVNTETVSDHARLIEALRRRDGRAAREAIIEHCEHTRRGLLAALIADPVSPLEL